ncbi:MAG: transcription antitermination factor NusB [Rickettsiales bacterium]|nr:transcription antitermination factor NusB [Rickettsiales bacterium]
MDQKKIKNKKAPLTRKRTLSRLMAVQIFYQFEFYEEKHSIDQIRDDLIDNYLMEQNEAESSYREKIDFSFLETLLKGMQLYLGEIDHEISPFLKENWSLQSLPDIMLYIIRFGSFELKYMKDVPLKVVIDEYVDIGASFFENKKVTFLNGILENLAKYYRAEEFAKVSTHKK